MELDLWPCLITWLNEYHWPFPKTKLTQYNIGILGLVIDIPDPVFAVGRGMLVVVSCWEQTTWQARASQTSLRMRKQINTYMVWVMNGRGLMICTQIFYFIGPTVSVCCHYTAVILGYKSNAVFNFLHTHFAVLVTRILICCGHPIAQHTIERSALALSSYHAHTHTSYGTSKSNYYLEIRSSGISAEWITRGQMNLGVWLTRGGKYLGGKKPAKCVLLKLHSIPVPLHG